MLHRLRRLRRPGVHAVNVSCVHLPLSCAALLRVVLHFGAYLGVARVRFPAFKVKPILPQTISKVLRDHTKPRVRENQLAVPT